MPYIVQGDPSSWKENEDRYRKEDFDYEYPDGLDLKPGSKFHNKIRSRIYTRATESRTEMSKRFASWREIDRVLTVYVPADDKEKIIKEKDPRRPISIVFPYTYSMLEALLTYMTMAFFQDPMFQYEGVEDDDTTGSMLMELLVRLHCIKTKVPLAVHTALRDAFSYGIGVGLPGWKRIFGMVPKRSKVVSDSELGATMLEDVTYVNELIFEGNDLSNIDPYMWLPDPSVSSANIQDGEFVGWIERDNFMNLLTDEANDENVFNVKYVKNKKSKTSELSRDQSDRETKQG
ncbi:unnamed protein product, partial [marine sediment metagenome]